MNLLNLIYSFRVRLLLVLATLLVMTLGVQYILNRDFQQDVERTIAEQERALAAGTALGIKSLSSKERLAELQQESNLFLLEKQAGRVSNILIIDDARGRVAGRLDSEDRIADSLDRTYNPRQTSDGTYNELKLSEISLPPFVDVDQAAAGRVPLPQSRAFPIPVDTDQGRNYIIIVLGSTTLPSSASMWQTARPLLATLSVLLLATLAAAFLVWRFTQPIRDLSEAAHRVATGDLSFRVPANRRDEMGALAAVFNNMIVELRRTRELEGQLNQAERSAVVGRLASAIAHEIRNPLNYINLTLDHMRSALAPEDEGKRVLFGRLTDQVKTEVARINTRISEFLNYSRPARLERRALDLRLALEDALQMVAVKAAESDIQMRIEQKTPVPPVLGDAESLRSVFTNLIINGLQALEGCPGGCLTINLSAAKDVHGEHAFVQITDTGPGIDPRYISQIFEPYFSTKETGTGLGLAIVKKAVEDHGGTISVESTHTAGTTFTITLPTTGKDERSIDER